jgi:hypothetical protein
MIQHSSWAQHLCSTHHVTVHDPTGSTVERVLSLGEGKATYTIDYHDQGTHVIIREVTDQWSESSPGGILYQRSPMASG